MDNFIRAFKTVIEHEGYYSNVKGDKGGETYMGVARTLHPTWAGWKQVDIFKESLGDKQIPRNFRIESEELETLVFKFYFETYWCANGIPLIENYNLKYIIFDWVVNSGRYGVQNVQRIVGVQQDGILGRITAEAINSQDPKVLFERIKDARIRYYNIIAEDGQNMKFLRGWLKRINSIKYII